MYITVKKMTGVQLLELYLKDAISESNKTGGLMSPQEIFQSYNISDIDPNKLYSVTTTYSDSSDDPIVTYRYFVIE
jgi:hypothetical protein